MKTNAPEFLANLCHEIYEEDPFKFNQRKMWREYLGPWFRGRMWKLVNETTPWIERVLELGRRERAKRYQGGLYQ